VFSLSPTWREIDAILVTELSRWGRSSIDLVQTLQSLQAWDVPVLANSGLQFDLSTPHGKMIASVMAALAEFERDLIRERIKSGIAAAKARGKRLGDQDSVHRTAGDAGPQVGRGWSELPVGRLPFVEFMESLYAEGLDPNRESNDGRDVAL
jgi:Resolvase, N terminal domain